LTHTLAKNATISICFICYPSKAFSEQHSKRTKTTNCLSEIILLQIAIFKLKLRSESHVTIAVMKGRLETNYDCQLSHFKSVIVYESERLLKFWLFCVIVRSTISGALVSSLSE